MKTLTILLLSIPLAHAQTLISHGVTQRNQCPITSQTCTAMPAIYSDDLQVICMSEGSVDWPDAEWIDSVDSGGMEKWLYPAEARSYGGASSTDCVLTFATVAGIAPIVHRSISNPVPWFVWTAEASGHFLPIMLAGNVQDTDFLAVHTGVVVRGLGIPAPFHYLSFQIMRAGAGEYESTYEWVDFADHVCAGVGEGLDAPTCTAAHAGGEVGSAIVVVY